ncbi:MAG: hypothetical protein EP297_14420 [Gammaproteobacteria bacterium]|nr:MAG: hypothetical protein EP297_14420 [Gammaproteobacteria bacterium]
MSANCTVTPARTSIIIPESGFSWRTKEEQPDACEAGALDNVLTEDIGQHRVSVFTDGPSGSGRYWTITVGLSSGGNKAMNRGFCLRTSTTGWRTLQKYERTPLPWLEDLDEDGQPELIIWDSFPLSDRPILSDYALVAWVYRLTDDRTFTLDRGLIRMLAAELSAAYQQQIPQASKALLSHRQKASQLLDSLASQECE